MYYHELNVNRSGESKIKKRVKIAFFIFISVIIVFAFFRLGSATTSVEVTNAGTFWQKVANILTFSQNESDPDDKNYVMPAKEDNRLDILVLGIRGQNDPEAANGGAFLTDTIIVINYDKITGKTAFVSIPRDLYIKLDKNKYDKVNAAYEYGLSRGKGLFYVESLISKITGAYIDNAVVVDFSSFKTVIDDLGGIDIYLDKPFMEKTQWGYEFSLSAGWNHLDGQSSLYYARSRFSSNDFDRSRRQYQIIMATKDKLLKLNVLSDPLKTLQIINTVRSNVHTDLNIFDVGSLLDLAKNGLSDAKPTDYVISTDNLLYQTYLQNSTYVLLPNGDNFDKIKQLFQDILK